jgi:hypothetical protein
MLTQLPTLKSRLAIPDTDNQYDALLTSAIKAVSARFDQETNRTLARTENAACEFDPDDTEIVVPCYPIETVTRFETKTSEATGWQEISPAPDYLIRHSCIISLPSPLSNFSLQPSAFSLCRVSYAGGYVLPGTDPAQGQVPLPHDLEQAAVEQAAEWFQNRDYLGLKTIWPTGVAYKQLIQLPLLIPVQQVLSRHLRWTF